MSLKRKCKVKPSTAAKVKLLRDEANFVEETKLAKRNYERTLLQKLTNNGFLLFKYIGHLRGKEIFL